MAAVIVAADLVTAAAGDIERIGSAIDAARAAAAPATTEVASAAADEVSVAIAAAFGAYAREHQTVSAQAAAFHDKFVNLLNGGMAAYDSAEAGNATAVSGAAAAGNPYQILFANTEANLQSLHNGWAADPFPFLRQIVANQQGYLRTVAPALETAIRNLPAELANFPADTQAAISALSTVNPGASLQQFSTTLQQFIDIQTGYVQTVATSLQLFGRDLGAGLPAFQTELGVANQALATGNYHGAVYDVTEGLLNLFITGFDTSNLNDIKLLGPAGDLLPILTIPGQEAQGFASLLPAGSVPEQMAQNFTNVVDALTDAHMSSTFSLELSLFPPKPPELHVDAYFGLPLSLAFGALGPPVATLDALATSATTIGQAWQAGNAGGVLAGLIDGPAVLANGYLNGQVLVDMTMTATVAGLPVPIVLHLPFDGLLVPPQPITATATVAVAGLPLAVIPLTLGGTPFAGIVPELVNYLPQQLAKAITPPA